MGHRMQPPLNALRTFEAVARHGSFSRAADALCVTQSAVSHQVRALEDWLGAPLFDRSGGGARLLPHGAELAASLALALAEIDRACGRARHRSGPPVLTVAAIPSIAVCWLIPRLADFRARAPGVELRILYAFHGKDGDLRDVDAAVVHADRPPRLPGFDARRFLPGASLPVCAPALADLADLAGTEPPIPPRALLRAGLLHDSDTTAWGEWLAPAGLAPPPGPVFEDFNLLRAAALAGQGVALCPPAVIRDDLAAGRLIALSERTVRADFAYYLLCRSAGDTPGLAAFADWLIGTAAEAGAP